MKYANRIFFVVSVFSLVLCSCTYRIDKTSPIGTIVPPRDLVSKISFNDVYTLVFRPKCIGCHDGGSGRINLESYQEARTNLAKIKEAALVKRIMPKAPYPALTENELITLAAWIEAGGPDQPINGDPNTPIPPDPLTPDFESIKKNIFEVKCMSCHKVGGKAEKVSLATREDLINSPRDIVIPGIPEESGLILDLQEDAIKKMPPPDSGISPVKPEEIDIIKEWITNGAQD